MQNAMRAVNPVFLIAGWCLEATNQWSLQEAKQKAPVAAFGFANVHGMISLVKATGWKPSQLIAAGHDSNLSTGSEQGVKACEWRDGYWLLMNGPPITK